MVDTDPLDISIFFSFPSAMKPRKRLSGDQNIEEARSVVGRGCASSELTARSHIIDRPSVEAIKASSDPSGETAGPLASERTFPVRGR